MQPVMPPPTPPGEPDRTAAVWQIHYGGPIPAEYLSNCRYRTNAPRLSPLADAAAQRGRNRDERGSAVAARRPIAVAVPGRAAGDRRRVLRRRAGRAARDR